MASYEIKTVHFKERQYKSTLNELEVFTDLNIKEYQNPGALLLSALGSCKVASFIELKEKYGINTENVELIISGITGNKGTVEGTRQPISKFLEINYKWIITTKMSKEEIEKYLPVVDGACTVGNSLDPSIKLTHEVEIR